MDKNACRIRPQTLLQTHLTYPRGVAGNKVPLQIFAMVLPMAQVISLGARLTKSKNLSEATYTV